MIIPLYEGTVALEFDETKHRFSVDGKFVPSVTFATGVIDKSGPLVWWAVGLVKDHLLAHLKDIIDDSNGERTCALIEEASKQHQIKKQQAADIGTQVHAWAEKFIKAKTKKDYPELPKDPKVFNGVTAFLKWVDEKNVKFLSSEKYVYSREHNFAGIMDAEAVICNKTSVVDFKTAKGIYPEFRLQVAAYQKAAEEESGKKYTGNKWIVRFGKEDGEFEAHEFTEQDKDFGAFLNALNLKRRLKEIEKPYKSK